MNYHSDYNRVSKTMLNHFCKSVEDYYHFYVKCDLVPPAPKREMLIGTAVHEILLEHRTFSDVCCIYPAECLKSNGAINPKPAAEFLNSNPGMIPLKEADAEIVRRACDAVHAHPLGALVRHDAAVFEEAIYWDCPTSQLECRAKPDFYIDNGVSVLAYDLKTTENIYPRDFERTAKMFRYWLQDAHYSAGLAAKFGKPVDFVFWVVEVKAPYRVMRTRYCDRSREIASDAYRSVMKRLADCYATEDWRDDWTTGTHTITLGPWDLDSTEEDKEVVYAGEE